MQSRFVFLLQDLKAATQVVKLKVHYFEEVYNSGSNLFTAIIFLAGPPVINLFLSSFLFPSGFGSIFSRVVFWPMMIPTLALVGSIFAMFLILAKYLAYKVQLKGFLKVLAFGSLLLWLTIIAFLLDLLGLVSVSILFNAIWIIGVVWVFVVAYSFLESHFKLSKRDLFIIIILGFICYFLLQSILGRILVGSYYRIFY